jgi:acetyl-CoA synthetase
MAFNIGVACVDWQPPKRTALVAISATGRRTRYAFGDLARLSNCFANGLLGLGLVRRDRVAVILPQGIEALVAALGSLKAGLIVVPMSSQLGIDALAYRLGDSQAHVIVTDSTGFAKLTRMTGTLNSVRRVLLVDRDAGDYPVASFWRLVDQGSTRAPRVATSAEDPAILLYTSGTTGNAKGVLHAHRVLIGQLPGLRLGFDLAPKVGDIFWTPADWSWIACTILGLLFLGVGVVAAPQTKFDPEAALHLLSLCHVRLAFLTPTALRMMRDAPIPSRLSLRCILTGGEPATMDLFDWCNQRLQTNLCEAYGQTEADLLIGNCPSVWPRRPGSMGLSYPGHIFRVVNDAGQDVPFGAVGELMLKAPDPAMLLQYWNHPDATIEKFSGDWLRTGDLVTADDAGYFWFHQRADNMIKSAGYRIGPDEIENCLLQHYTVSACAVVGAPDELRGHVVKAYIVLKSGVIASAAVEAELKQHVKTRLAAHEYPRLIEFVNELPQTPSGKVDLALLRLHAAGVSSFN